MQNKNLDPQKPNPETLTLTIHDLSRGGAGVGKDPEGRVVFVPYTAPGDEVEVEILSQKKHYAQGKMLKLLKPSPIRQTPRCPAFGECGGCDWQHIPYSLQWETKKKGVWHALQRIHPSLLELWNTLEEFPAEQIWNYRNRVQLRGKGRSLGFFRSRSLELIPLDHCDIADTKINDAWEATRREGSFKKFPYKVELEVQGNQVQKSWNSRHSASGFQQVHDAQNEKLKNWVQNQITRERVLYDFFGGGGNLSLPLASFMRAVHCVDFCVPPQPPVRFPQYFFHAAEVVSWMEKFQPSLSGPASAIIDPPRMGLDQTLKAFAKGCEKLGVSEVIFIGCEVDAWARDLKGWTEQGWDIQKMMILDFFPQTHHIESVALLRKKEQ